MFGNMKSQLLQMNSEKQESLLKLSILTIASVLCKYTTVTASRNVINTLCFTAFSTRLFSVLRFESVIHEFDPYFNYRTTQYLADEGFYKFHNWFDERAWYPLGRIIGGKLINLHHFSNFLIMLKFFRNHLSWIDVNCKHSLSCHEFSAYFH